MPNCAILSCKNSNRTVSKLKVKVTFHSFPRDPDTKEKWMDATGRRDWFPTKFSKICSVHFTEDDFCATEHIRRLREKAYPTKLVLSGIPRESTTEPTIKEEAEDGNESKKNKSSCFLSRKVRDLTERVQKQALVIKKMRSKEARNKRKIETLLAVIDSLQPDMCNVKTQTDKQPS